MFKQFLFSLLILGLSNLIIEAPTLPVLKTDKNKVRANKRFFVRLTVCNYRSKVNHLGQRLPKNKNICAVEKGMISQGTKIYIPKINKTFTVFDRMHQPSVNKHKRIAKKRGKSIDTCLDLYYNVPAKYLREKDLGYQEIWIYGK